MHGLKTTQRFALMVLVLVFAFAAATPTPYQLSKVGSSGLFFPSLQGYPKLLTIEEYVLYCEGCLRAEQREVLIHRFPTGVLSRKK